MRKMTRSISMLAAALLLGVPVRSPMHVRSARPATHPMRPIESGATAGATRGRRETHGGRNSMASFARIDPTPTSLKSQPAPAYRIRNKSTRQRFLGLIVALSAALLVGGAIPAATAAHGALGGQTAAYCQIHWPSSTYRITGDHPTGTTGGKTLLAAGVRSAQWSPNGWKYMWRGYFPLAPQGGYWISTNSARLPLGHFYTASTWYRSSVIGFPAGGGTHHRIEWLVRWPDGHDSVVYSAWVGCF